MECKETISARSPSITEVAGGHDHRDGDADDDSDFETRRSRQERAHSDKLFISPMRLRVLSDFMLIKIIELLYELLIYT